MKKSDARDAYLDLIDAVKVVVADDYGLKHKVRITVVITGAVNSEAPRQTIVQHGYHPEPKADETK